MSTVKTDVISEHTTGAGIETDVTLKALGYAMQPDELDVDMTIPVGYTLYVQKAMVVADDHILNVQGTLKVL